MRIAIVTEFFPKSEKIETRGGAEARAFHVAKHLAKKHEVTVITSRERGVSHRSKFLNIEVIRVGKERKYSQGGSLPERLSFIHKGVKVQKKFDIIDGYNFVSYPLAWKIAQKQGASAIATYHDVWIGRWVQNIGLSGIFGELLERYVLSKKWDKFIAVSGYVKDALVKRGIERGKIEIIPNGVEIGEFEDVKIKKSRDPTVCCISRLVEYKHVNILIDALALVKKEIKNVKCVIIGTGPLREKLESQVNKLGLGENIKFFGTLEHHREVIGVLKSSHILCLPSTVEGFGMVLLEAMASRVPFVASEIKPLVETTGRRGGLFFKPLDHENLARKLLLLLKDEKLQKRLVRDGVKQAKKYDWGTLVEKIEDVYERTV